jgi:hypothetical protein
MERDMKNLGAQKKPKPHGVVEWPDKLIALKILYGGVSTDRELARKIMAGDPDPRQGSNLLDQIVDLIKTQWLLHTPTGGLSKIYIRRVLDQINVRISEYEPNKKMSEFTLVQQRYAEFRAFLPEHLRELIPSHHPSYLDDSASYVSFDEDDDVAHIMWIPRHLKFETIKAGVDRGHIDQKFCYLTPDAVAHWEGVVSSGQYALYDHCRDTLAEFATCDLWRDFFEKENGRGIMMLGGGSASKDILLIQSALRHLTNGEVLKYRIVDISNYMGLSAFQLVDAHLRGNELRQRVDLIAVHWDFMHLRRLTDRIRTKNEKLAWFMPGNTFGNINEAQFLRSLSSKAENGDILVVGAEILQPGNRQSSIEIARTHYENREIRDLVSPALTAIWRELNSRLSFKEMQNQIRVEVRERNEHSAVRDAVTIELALPLKDLIVLLTSTKYSSDGLVDYARGFGFEKEMIVTLSSA